MPGMTRPTWRPVAPFGPASWWPRACLVRQCHERPFPWQSGDPVTRAWWRGGPVLVMNESRVARDVVALGGSAGELAALKTILAGLPARLPATLAIVVHRSATFESQLAELLDRICPLPVREPVDGEPIRSGHV